MTATAKAGDTVTIDFTVRLASGHIVGGTRDAGPQDVVIGEGGVFPDVEDALTGLGVGETVDVVVPSDNAFGPRQDELLILMNRSQLPAEAEPVIGMQLVAQAPDGQDLNLTVIKIEDDDITLDGNHPLAGEDLTFHVELLAVK